MNYIKESKTEESPCGNKFDVLFLNSGKVIVIYDNLIAIFRTVFGFESGTETPVIVHLDELGIDPSIPIN